MQIITQTAEGVTLIQITGQIDGNNVSIAQEQILPLTGGGAKLIMDMTGVEYMSSAGLRMMLMIHRQTSGDGGQVVLVGLNEDIQDTMSATGFLTFFEVFPSVEEGFQALQ